MLEILDGFALIWVLMYWYSKSSFLQVALNCEFWIFISFYFILFYFILFGGSKWMLVVVDIQTQIYFAHHIAMYWSLLKVLIERLHK